MFDVRMFDIRMFEIEMFTFEISINMSNNLMFYFFVHIVNIKLLV